MDLLLGHRVVGLLQDGSRVVGARVRDSGGTQLAITARLVVGADGRHSAVAGSVGAAEDTARNERFLFWAYYRDARLRGRGHNQVWFLEPDVAVATPTDDGLTLLAAFPGKARLPEFQADRPAALEAFLRALPDAPDLTCAERVSPAIGTTDYPPLPRDPRPLRAWLIGDAAMTGDPVPAVGCGWAFRSAEWLAEATVPALWNGRGPDRAVDRALDEALRRYRRTHRFAERHDRMDRGDALARPANPVQRALRTASVHDPLVARRLYLYANRALPVTGLLNPRVVLRAVRVSRRSGSSRTWRRPRPEPISHPPGTATGPASRQDQAS